MALSKEYAELKARCLMCVSHGYKIGKAESYVAALQVEVGEPLLPQGVDLNSPQHLLLLLDMFEKGEMAVKAPKASPKKAPEPVKAPEPAPVVEVTEAVEVAEVAAPEVVAPEPEPSKPAKKSRR